MLSYNCVEMIKWIRIWVYGVFVELFNWEHVISSLTISMGRRHYGTVGLTYKWAWTVLPNALLKQYYLAKVL